MTHLNITLMSKHNNKNGCKHAIKDTKKLVINLFKKMKNKFKVTIQSF
jgi:hypothetical protein